MGKFAESVLKDIVRGEALEVFKKANFATQRSLKRTANDYLFIESLCARMKDISLDEDDTSAAKQLTRRGLAKWMVLLNRLPSEARDILLKEENGLLEKLEKYSIKNPNFEWTVENILNHKEKIIHAS